MPEAEEGKVAYRIRQGMEGICKTKRNPPLGEGLVLHVYNSSIELFPHAFAEVNVPNACVYLFKPHHENTLRIAVKSPIW